MIGKYRKLGANQDWAPMLETLFYGQKFRIEAIIGVLAAPHASGVVANGSGDSILDLCKHSTDSSRVIFCAYCGICEHLKRQGRVGPVYEWSCHQHILEGMKGIHSLFWKRSVSLD